MGADRLALTTAGQQTASHADRKSLIVMQAEITGIVRSLGAVIAQMTAETADAEFQRATDYDMKIHSVLLQLAMHTEMSDERHVVLAKECQGMTQSVSQVRTVCKTARTGDDEI